MRAPLTGSGGQTIKASLSSSSRRRETTEPSFRPQQQLRSSARRHGSAGAHLTHLLDHESPPGPRQPPESSPSSPGRSSSASDHRGSPQSAALSRAGSVTCCAAGFLVAVAAFLVLPLQAQAQTVQTLVSNTGQGGSSSLSVGVQGSNKWSMAVGFTTGDNLGGYTLSSVQALVERSNNSSQLQVSIYGADTSGDPGSSLYVLDNPSPIVDDALNTFTAPTRPTLAKETQYFVVFEAPTGSVGVEVTNANAEDADKANGWSISDKRHVRSSDAGSWSQSSNAFKPKIAVMGTIDEPTAVTIEAEHDSIGGGVEDLDFTLTREGETTDELDVTVTITQDQSWLGDSDLSHDVTFEADSATVELTIAASRFSFAPSTTGDLTATVTGDGIDGDSETVAIISTSEPPFTISYEESEYTFAEDATDAAVYALATLDPAYPRAPSNSFEVNLPTRSNTAMSPGDYVAISGNGRFSQSDFARDVDTDPLVARTAVPGFAIVNDDIYEGSEYFRLRIEFTSGLPVGLTRFANPDGTTCTGFCVAEYRVNITDEEDVPDLSLSVDPSLIDEEDDDGTTGTAENVSTVTVEITNGKTFAVDQTVTLTFSGTATQGAHYSVSPGDADSGTAGHQVVLVKETASVEVTVTATGNDTADGNRTVTVAADLDGTAIGSSTITILEDDTRAQALVSNTGQDLSATNWTVGGGNNYVHAQGFTTGDDADGYTLFSVQVVFRDGFDAGDEVKVSIYGADASGNPGSSLYELTNPSLIVNNRLNTFTAPTRPTLEKETDYFIVVEAPAGSFFVSSTTSDDEDDGAASGWSINDDRRRSTPGVWSSISDPLPIAVRGTIGVPPAVTIEAEYERIGGALEDLDFELTREGETTDALDVTVTIVQDESWLGDSDLEHDVTFLADEATVTLTITASKFSFAPSNTGNLTATVTGNGIDGDSESVEIISTSEPPITISYEESEYTFAEEETDAAVYALATLDAAYPRGPSNFFEVNLPTRSNTAMSPGDYAATSGNGRFSQSDFARDVDTDPLVARTAVPGFAIVNDDIYEGSEFFRLRIEYTAGLPVGLTRFANPNGTTCTVFSCAPEYRVNITDEEDLPALLLSALPASIAEEDDDGTAGTAENVSTVRVEITNGKTFAVDQTVTLTFSGTATQGAHYNVTPGDADRNEAGHQVVLVKETASVEVTVTATTNSTADGNRTVKMAADLDGTAIGSTDITIRDDDTTAPALVSNTGQVKGGTNWTVGGGNNYVHAQGFTTGDEADGYTLFSVQVVFRGGLDSGDEVKVSIWGADASGDPGSSLYELTNPSSIVNNRLNTFTAPTRPTLEKETDYFIVVEATTGSFFVSSTTSDDEDDGAASGWSINDDRRRFTRGVWSSLSEPLSIAVMGTIGEATAVTIEAEHDSIGGGVEDLKFTLTRTGATTAALDAKVTITQDQSWLGSSDLDHDVTFLAGSATAELTITASKFSFAPSTTGDLTARVSGDGINGGSETVEIISTSEPPFTISYEESEYTFAEDEYTDIYAVSTFNVAYPRAPSRLFFLAFGTRDDTAKPPEDYPALSWQTTIANRLYAREAETDPFVARLPLSDHDFAIVDDDIYEGPERFGLIIEGPAGYPVGIAQLKLPDGTTCDLQENCPTHRFWVNITDEEDLPELSLSVDPASIVEDDDDGTTGTAENVSTVRVEITNGKTFAVDQTVTLTFTGTATQGTHYSVSPGDADTNTAGHQVVLVAGESSVEVTVTATGNDTADGNRTVTVAAGLDGTAIGSSTITIVDDETTTITTVPHAPTSLTATANGSTQIDLSWTAPADNGGSSITGYRIEVSSDAGSSWTEVADTDDTNTTYAHTGLSPGTTLHYRVSAINSVGTGAASNVDDATTESEVAADWDLKPSGLSGGDKFRLLFITSTTRDAVPTAIADYNTFVQNRAAAGHPEIKSHSSGFRAVGSTEDVDARDNTSTTYTSSDSGLPIYWLDGNKAADDYEDFYDGDWDEENTLKDESGTTVTVTGNTTVWTGSDHDGTEATSILSVALGRNPARTGRPGTTTGSGPLNANANLANTETRRLYALSSVFVVEDGTTLSSDATLSALTVDDGTTVHTIDLATTPYTVDVGNAVEEVTLTATTTHTGASVSAVTLGGTAIADTDFTDGITVPSLAEGDNVIVVTVTAEDGSTTETYTVTVTVAGTSTVPGAPTSLTATANGSTQIDLSWDAPASDGGASITGYRIEVSPNGTSSWTDREANTGTTTTTYDHTGLSAGTTRHYRVSAINSVGTGAASNVDDATTDAAATTAPAIVTDGVEVTSTAAADDTYRLGETIKITVTFDNAVTVNASAVGPPRIQFRLDGAVNKWAEYSSGSGGTDLVFTYVVQSGDMDDDGIRLPGNFIRLRSGTITAAADNTVDAILAYDEPGVQTEHKVNGSTVPGAPTGLTATASGSTQIDLSWTAPSSDGGSPITGYRIEVSSDGGTIWQALITTTSTGGSHTGLSAGTTRHYRVSAINANGTGTASNVDDATTPTVPGAPTGLTATASGTSTIDLAWTAPSSDGGSAITGYRIEISSDGSSSWTDLVADTDDTNTTYEDRFPVGTTRHYRVSAINSVGTGAASNVATLTVPGAPTGLTATAGGTSTIDLAWTAPSNDGGSAITGYRIEVSSDAGSSWVILVVDTDDTNTTYEDHLPAGSTRHYRVSAINSVGTGAASNVDDATTDDAATTAPQIVTDGVEVTSTAAADETYRLGETIEITVTFDNAVTVNASSVGPPRIQFRLDGAVNKWAEYSSGSGGTALEFTYDVQSGDMDDDGIRLPGNFIRLRSGTITAAADNTVDAILAYPEPGLQTEHKVDGSTVPGAPTSLTATASGTTTIDLSWTAPSSDGGSAITGYRIEISLNGGSSWGDLVGNTGSTSTTYSDISLNPGDTRHYRVSAINANGTGDASNVDDATTLAVPGAPTGLTATADGSTAIDLSWDAPSSDGGASISGYRIAVSPNGTSSWTELVANTGNTTTIYSHTGLDAGTTRHYRVWAINSVGIGAGSNVDDATTDDAAATAPAIVTDGVQVTSTPDTGDTYGLGETIEITVTFDNAVTVNASAVGPPRIQFRLDGSLNKWAEYSSGSGGTDLEFTYDVQSGDMDDDGIWLPENFLRLRSGTITATADNTVDAILTYDEPGLQPGHKVDGSTSTVPGAPTSLTATASGTSTIDLSWTAPSNDGGASISGYKIEVSPNGNSNWSNRVANTGSTTTSYAHTGLSAGTTRHYRVSAINSVGTGAASNVDDATTDATTTTVPGAPTGLSATPSGTSAINLTWDAPSSDGGASITGYRIEVSPNGNSNWTNREGNTGSTSTSYSHTGLDAGSTRHYRVSAINSVGTGDASSTANATTDDDDQPGLAVVTVHALATSVPAGGLAKFELRRTGGDMGSLKVSYRHDESDGNYVRSWGSFKPGETVKGADYYVGESTGTVTASVTGPSVPLCTPTDPSYASCTDNYRVGDPSSASMPVTASASASADALEDALTLVDGLTPDVAAAVLLGEQTLGEAELAALDRLGNGNGRYDLGDLLAWIERCRRGEARCGSTSTGSGPPSAAGLLAAAAAGGRSTPRRPGRRGSGRPGRKPICTARRRGRFAGYALATLLAATMTLSCTEGSVGPAAYVPDPGFLTVEWSGPAAHRDVGVLLEFEGPAIDAVRAPGFELYESSAAGPRRVVVAGSLRPGPFVQFRVPDRGQFALYSVRVLEVTGEDYGLRDPTEYRAVVVMN